MHDMSFPLLTDATNRRVRDTRAPTGQIRQTEAAQTKIFRFDERREFFHAAFAADADDQSRLAARPSGVNLDYIFPQMESLQKPHQRRFRAKLSP